MARRRNNSPLLWALLASALINHAVFLPAAYFLLYEKPRVEPEVLEVALVPDEREPQAPLVLPKVPPLPRQRPPRARPQPKQKPKPLAKKKPPKPEPPKPKPKPKQQPPPEPPDPTMRMKMVEVQNPESETPPDDARFLSDKNRRVERETRARQTNLVKDHPKPKPVSRPNKLPKPEPGAKKKKIAEIRRQKAKKPRPKKVPKAHPLLVMRAPVKPRAARPEQKPLAQQTPDGQLPAPAPKQRARARRKRIDLNLNHRSHDRIYGKEALRQRELARLSPSTPTKGSHQKKWERIRSSLENFIPEVRPGNQTALGTRAHPFALYIARMHRSIHRLWGFGFLVDMDNKPDRHPMNNMKLWTMIEVVVEPSGKVQKATIVRPSGILTYDVAALDTVFAGGPYPPTPRAIRSKDGKVYLHWRFHRNQRQCGTFGVDPFILTKPPTGPIDSTMAEVLGQPGPRRAGPRRLNRPHRGHTGQASAGHRHPHAGQARAGQGAGAATKPSKRQLEAARAAARKNPRADLGRAKRAARRFIQAFDRRDPGAMAAACDLPFRAQGRKVAKQRQVLRRMFGDLVREAAGARADAVKLMTVSEARSKLGKLPAGAEYGAGMVVGQVQLGRVPVTLLLQERAGSWKVIGLNR